MYKVLSTLCGQYSPIANYSFQASSLVPFTKFLETSLALILGIICLKCFISKIFLMKILWNEILQNINASIKVLHTSWFDMQQTLNANLLCCIEFKVHEKKSAFFPKGYIWFLRFWDLNTFENVIIPPFENALLFSESEKNHS